MRGGLIPRLLYSSCLLFGTLFVAYAFAGSIPGQVRGEIPNLDFSPDSFGSISGRVVSRSDGAGMERVQIRVYNKAWTWLYNKYTDGAGNYLVEGLKPGTYYLATSNSLGYLDEAYDDIPTAVRPFPPEGAKAVVVEKQAKVSGIDFSLDFGGAISGQITRTGDGTPLKDIAVTLSTEDWTAISRVVTDETGKYAIMGLPAGSFYLKTTNNQGYVDVHYAHAVFEKDAEPIEMSNGVKRVADFRLAPGGSISGKVGGGPHEEALELVEVRVYDEKWRFAKNGFTDPVGHFSIGGLPGGLYFVRTLSGSDYIDECHDNAADPSHASSVKVREGVDTPGVGFALLLGGSISGQITAGGRKAGIQEVYINVYDMEGKHAGGAPSDLSGRYTIRKIPPGKYFVRSSNVLGYPDLYYPNAAEKGDAKEVSVASGTETKDINFTLAQ